MNTLPKYSYPPCPVCDCNRPAGSGLLQATEPAYALMFQHISDCSCGHTTNDPPHVVRCIWQNTRYFVRVAETLQNTEVGRNAACNKIPFQWRRAAWGFRFIEERMINGARYWIFEQLDKRYEL